MLSNFNIRVPQFSVTIAKKINNNHGALNTKMQSKEHCKPKIKLKFKHVIF